MVRRVYEHKEGISDGFTKKYNVKILVYFKIHTDINKAIKREKTLKKWKRNWKIELIEKTYIQWKDLFPDITN